MLARSASASSVGGGDEDEGDPSSSLSQAIAGEVELFERGVHAQCLCDHPSSALSQFIRAKVERRERSVHTQCVCDRPSSLSQAIRAKVERRKRGVEAQCLCQRTSSALSQAIRAKVELCERGIHAQCLCDRPSAICPITNFCRSSSKKQRRVAGPPAECAKGKGLQKTVISGACTASVATEKLVAGNFIECFELRHPEQAMPARRRRGCIRNQAGIMLVIAALSMLVRPALSVPTGSVDAMVQDAPMNEGTAGNAKDQTLASNAEAKPSSENVVVEEHQSRPLKHADGTGVPQGSSAAGKQHPFRPINRVSTRPTPGNAQASTAAGASADAHGVAPRGAEAPNGEEQGSQPAAPHGEQGAPLEAPHAPSPSGFDLTNALGNGDEELQNKLTAAEQLLRGVDLEASLEYWERFNQEAAKKAADKVRIKQQMPITPNDLRVHVRVHEAERRRQEAAKKAADEVCVCVCVCDIHTHTHTPILNPEPYLNLI